MNNFTSRKDRKDCMTERGRSMVEMLGMLAVMSVLALTGVKAYTYAMNKHRANELIYEAQKRASAIAMLRPDSSSKQHLPVCVCVCVQNQAFRHFW